MEEEESKIIIVNESSMEESESECAHKSVNKEKDANSESEHEEPTVMYDPVIKEPRCFNIFECGKNLLNKIDANFKLACMATPRDKYHTELFRTITDCNNCNDAPFSNGYIIDTINRVISEEIADAYNITSDTHNVTVDNFSQTPNAQRENENAILTNEKGDKLDAPAETLKGLKIDIIQG